MYTLAATAIRAIFYFVYLLNGRPNCFTSHQQTSFMDSTAAIDGVRPDAIGTGQRFAVSTIEVCSRILSRGHEVAVRWVYGVTGNERADECA